MIRSVIACMLSLVAADAVAQPISVSVWYAGPGAHAPATNLDAPSASIAADLDAFRRAGFTGIVTWVTWADVEARPGALALATAEALIANAAQRGLDVRVRIYADVPPAWALPEATAARARFVEAVSERIGALAGVKGASISTPAEAGRITVGGARGSLPEARLAFWSHLADGVREISVDDQDGLSSRASALGETIGTVTRNEALFAPLRPRQGGVREITGARADLTIRFLESAQAIVIIALNQSAAATTATILFDRDVPEAIWQNLETGAAVNFVMGKTGPFLQHTFAARDALVLMIRKTLR